MTRKQFQILGGLSVLVLLMVGLFAAESYYARRIAPRGIATTRDFLHRFGEPVRVHLVQNNRRRYYEFTASPQPGFALALASAPPVYVFDEQGYFRTWCRDPGDLPSYRHTWALLSPQPVELSAVREKFGW